MADSTVLWLVRHPEPEASVRGRCYGTLDVGLSPAGLRHAELIADGLANEPFAAVYTSPRTRCTFAARVIAAKCGSPLEELDDLRELDFGAFEGLTYDEIAERYPDAYRSWMERPTETDFPGGETFAEMWTRVMDALRYVRTRHSGQSIAFVTHGGVIRILLADALGLQSAEIFRIPQSYGALNRIRYDCDSASVEFVNREVAREPLENGQP
jgi:alpha-ribazole phosphatase